RNIIPIVYNLRWQHHLVVGKRLKIGLGCYKWYVAPYKPHRKEEGFIFMFSDEFACFLGCLTIGMYEVVAIRFYDGHHIPSFTFDGSIRVILYQFSLTGRLPFSSLAIE